MSARHLDAGFTLVELLVGLAIAGIVLLPLTDLLYTSADSARATRSALDAQADARLALDRIAARAASAPGATLAPLEFKLDGSNLVEIDNSIKPVRTSVLATNVTSLQLDSRAAEPGGRPVLRMALGLDPATAACGEHCVLTRTVRLGATP